MLCVGLLLLPRKNHLRPNWLIFMLSDRIRLIIKTQWIMSKIKLFEIRLLFFTPETLWKQCFVKYQLSKFILVHVSGTGPMFLPLWTHSVMLQLCWKLVWLLVNFKLRRSFLQTWFWQPVVFVSCQTRTSYRHLGKGHRAVLTYFVLDSIYLQLSRSVNRVLKLIMITGSFIDPCLENSTPPLLLLWIYSLMRLLKVLHK